MWFVPKWRFNAKCTIISKLARPFCKQTVTKCFLLNNFGFTPRIHKYKLKLTALPGNSTLLLLNEIIMRQITNIKHSKFDQVYLWPIKRNCCVIFFAFTVDFWKLEWHKFDMSMIDRSAEKIIPPTEMER